MMEYLDGMSLGHGIDNQQFVPVAPGWEVVLPEYSEIPSPSNGLTSVEYQEEVRLPMVGWMYDTDKRGGDWKPCIYGEGDLAPVLDIRVVVVQAGIKVPCVTS